MKPARVRSFVGCIVLAFACMGSVPAHAIEITCVEASKYKYIFRIFDNDPRSFARFFVEEAAEIVNATATAVKMRTFYARRKLAELLAAEGGLAGPARDTGRCIR